MKSILASVLLMATSAQACIRVHAYMWSSGTFHDSMDVDVWDNNDLHCATSQSKSADSASTRWKLECGGDSYYKVVLWDNGGSGTVEHKVAGDFGVWMFRLLGWIHVLLYSRRIGEFC
jgi:hypothetical protein